MSLHKLEGQYYEAYKNQVRDARTSPAGVASTLGRLGRQVAREIARAAIVPWNTTMLPTSSGPESSGARPQLPTTLVITAKEEAFYLGENIADELEAQYRGFIHLGNVRGQAALTAPIQESRWPTIDKPVDLLVVAKSVLASGCTATALVRRAMERVQPARVAIAAIFYSEQGLQELHSHLPHAELFVLGTPDRLTDDGLLEDGPGLLEERLSGVPGGRLFDPFGAVDDLDETDYVPDALTELVYQRLDTLIQAGLGDRQVPLPLELYGLARHYTESLAAAQSVGQGSAADLVNGISLDHAQRILQRLRSPKVRRALTP